MCKHHNSIISKNERVHKTARRHLNKFYITLNYIITLDCSYNADGSSMVGR